MNFVPRLFRLNSVSFRFNGKGSSASQASRKVLISTAYLVENLKNNSYGQKAFKRFYNLYRRPKPFFTTKLVKLNLPQIIKNAENLPPGLLAATFNKLLIIYKDNKGNHSFENMLAHFLQEGYFTNFCQTLEKELQNLKPSDLLPLLYLVNFNVSPKSVLMRKLFALILDNLYFYSLFEWVTLYSEIKELKLQNIKECSAIIKACEEYFKTSFKDDICHVQNFEELIYLIPDQNLPIEVRKLITEKCFEMSYIYTMRGYPKFFTFAFEEPIASLFRTRLLEKFNSIINFYPLPKLISDYIKIYAKGIHFHDFLYDKDICDGIAAKAQNMGYKLLPLTDIVNDLCMIGHFSQGAVDRIAEMVLNRSVITIPPKSFYNIVSVLARVSYHEMNNSNWETIKDLLMSYNIMNGFKDYPVRLFHVCKSLTYVGCDTSKLLKTVFEQFEKTNVPMSDSESRSILRLYHLAQKYFPDKNLVFNSLDYVLQNSVYKKHVRWAAFLHKFFGDEKYVLYNAMTPDLKLLPFVVILGENGSPIDLISYKPKTNHIGFNKNFRAITNVKHLEQPDNSKMIVFLPYYDIQPFKYRNASLESGHMRMFLQSYENTDCNLVLLPPHYFYLEPNDKKKYLQSELEKIINDSKTPK